MHFIVGNHLKYICAILNSKLFQWLLYLIVGDADGGNAGNADNVKNLQIPKPTSETEKLIENFLSIKDYYGIDCMVYELFELSQEDIQFIETHFK